MIGSWLLSVGAAYFVFSETLDVYSGKDERFKRFQDAAIQFIGSLADIAGAAPLYKLFPTKPYRLYLQKLNAVQDIGKSLSITRDAKYRVLPSHALVVEVKWTAYFVVCNHHNGWRLRVDETILHVYLLCY